jgi:hypothetical protein
MKYTTRIILICLAIWLIVSVYACTKKLSSLPSRIEYIDDGATVSL